jgi:membrane-associated phospholipid phosphatase
MQSILQADRYLFHIVNGVWHNAFFDTIFPLLRQAEFWIPFYLFLLVFVVMNVRKSGWYILIMTCTVAISDMLSSRVIKELVWRPRPCRDPQMEGLVRTLVSYCPQSSSFTSSHAVNHFAIATFLVITLYPFFKKWIFWLYGWAFVIIWAQVYVGVHYPFDVLSGAVVGALIGYGMGRFCNSITGYPAFKERTATT